MAPRYQFGKALAEARQAQGYDSAYAFYKSRGGPRGLGMTFANYLGLEKGTTLPKGWRLKGLLAALGLMPNSARSRALVQAFLVDVTGWPELVAGIFEEKRGDTAPAVVRLAAMASKQVLSARRAQLSAEQLRALAVDPLAYACCVLLKTCEPGFTVAELARLTGAKEAAVQKSVKDLAAVGLVKLAKGRATCPISLAYIDADAITVAHASLFAAMHRHRAQLVEAHGRVIRAPHLIIRATKAGIDQYLEHLAEAVTMGNLFADNSGGVDSAVYHIEGRVSRLFELAESRRD